MPSFPNPCAPSEPIPSYLHRFVHTRPALDWKPALRRQREPGLFDGSGNAQVVGVGEPGSPVSGPAFGGNCSTGGVWYTTASPSVSEHLFSRRVRSDVDQKLRPRCQRSTDRGATLRSGRRPPTVSIATNPVAGGLYFVDYAATLHKISYVGGGNEPPVARATADLTLRRGASFDQLHRQCFQRSRNGSSHLRLGFRRRIGAFDHRESEPHL